jgi:hypothetical protein
VGESKARGIGPTVSVYAIYSTLTQYHPAIISAHELHRRFRAFLRQTYGGQQSILVVIDGKTLRGTIPKGKTRGLHLIAAYLPAEAIVLAQMPVDKKENEIVVAPKLLEQLDLKRRIVIGDAMFTQRNLSVQVKAQGGETTRFKAAHRDRGCDVHPTQLVGSGQGPRWRLHLVCERESTPLVD